MRRAFWTLAYTLLLTACGGCQGPAPGPTPVPPPIPTPTPEPGPQPAPTPPVGDPVPWATSSAIHAGMTLAELEALVGRPGAPKTMDDGSVIYRWPALGEAGAARWLDVQVERDLVLGHALWPR